MERLSEQIAIEQVRVIYQQLPSSVFAVFSAGLLVFLFWNVHPHALLLGWLGLVVVVNGVAAGLLYYFYCTRGRDNLAPLYWRKWMLAYVFVVGVVWGLIGALFYPAPTEYKFLVVVWLWALGSGMSSLLVSYRPAFHLMIVPLLAPLIVSTALDSDGIFVGLSAATFLWMLAHVYFHYVNNRTMFQAISLRFTNARLVEELTLKNKEVEKAALAKTQFLAAASHDLRQPLHAQGLFLAELDQYVDDPMGRRIMGGLEGSIYAMRGLLNSILDISKLDAGVVEPSLKPCQMQSIFRELELEFELDAKQKGIDLQFHPCDMVILTDVTLFGSVLRNLISNALHYTSNGSVQVLCRCHASKVQIQVKDTGVGIEASQQAEIFAPFVQLGNPERDREKGLGLGLSIVERITRLLGYEVAVESVVGQGSVFTIDMPASVVTQQAVATVISGSEIRADNSGKRILVIDDEAAVRAGMLGLLTSWGFVPVGVESIEEAVSTCESDFGDIDIILADFRLSGNATGIQAIEVVRARAGRVVPAAIITGDTSPDRLREVDESGHPILHKPVMPGDLRELVDALCQP